MGLEPQKFFIGLFDFFSVWLPGALLTYCLIVLPGVVHPSEMVASDWVVFLVASYLVGHFVFLIGSLLDTPVYDRLRRATPRHQIDRLAKGRRLSWRPVRFFAGRVFAKFDGALAQAERLRDEELEAVGAGPVINAFQWCKVRLSLDNPAALAEIERLEADSKFFRSFCVILGVLALWAGATMFIYGTGLRSGLRIDWWASFGLFASGLAVLGFALWRYAERRNRATTQAYWLVLGMAKPRLGHGSPPSLAPDAATHAAGVVLRWKSGRAEYLRVRASKNWQAEFDAGLRGRAGPAPEWVLPKGHIEPGEAPGRAAVREVLEEAAIWARLRDELTIAPPRATDGMRIRFFVMEYLGRAPVPKTEKHRWLRMPRPGGDDARPTDWQPLDEIGDLPPESRQAVRAARAYLTG